MTRFISGALGIILLATLACTPHKEELTADNIIANAIKAYGGENALRGITSKYIQGTTLIYIYDSLIRSNPFLSYEKSPSKSYYISPPGGEGYRDRLIFASNGTSSWTQNDGALFPYPQPQSEHRNTGGEDFPFLFTLKERGIETKFIQTIQEEGLTLYRVDYITENSTEEVYFNADTWLIFKTRKFIETSQGTAESIRYNRDYRNVSGTMVPFRTESFFPPRELNVHLINKMEINIEIDNQLFEYPAGPALSQAELEQLKGTYRSSGGEFIEIVRKGDALFVTTKNQSEIPTQIVAHDFMMYRDGTGDGSRMANLFLKTDKNNKSYLEHILRQKKTRLYRD
jgi:hypothetical protein